MTNRHLVSGLLILTLSAPLARASETIAPQSGSPGSWTILPNAPQAAWNIGRHDDIWFLDATTGWIVNGNGDVYRTQDGGDSWALLTYTGAYNRCVSFTDAQNGWIGLLYQLGEDALLHTTNGGATWEPVSLPEPKPVGMCGMQAVDGNTVCVVGAYYGYPRFVRTDDGGANWSVQDMSAYCGALVDTYWFDEQTGLVIGSTTPGSTRRARILRTTDGGATWSIVYTGTRDQELGWKLSFVSSKVGFVSIENLAETGACYFLKTTDGGESWTEHLFSPTYLNCQGIGFTTEYYGWLGGWNIGTAVTRDGGATWTPNNFGYNLNRVRMLSPYLGYACGRNVYKFVADPSAVGETPPARPAWLSQNRPNPASARTTIAFRIDRPGRVSLRLYDSQGRLVRDIFGGERSAGEYTESIDAGRLAAGTYYYELRTPAGVETKKLVVAR